MAGDMNLDDGWLDASNLPEALGAVVMILRNILFSSWMWISLEVAKSVLLLSS